MALGAQGFGEDSHRTAGESELHDQRQYLQLRRWNAIELRQTFLVVTRLGEFPPNAVANAAAVWAEMTHKPQAANATASVPSQVDDEAWAREFRNGAADVAGDIDAEDARKHAHAH